MKVSPRMLIIAGLVAVVAVLVLTRPEGADVTQARKDTQKAITRATEVLKDNASLEHRADSALAEAAKQEKAAVVAEAKLAVAKRDLFKAALAAPDTCAPVVLAAQVALNQADSVIDTRTRELAAALAADSADRKRAEDAEAALDNLRKPAQTLVSTSKPSLLQRLRPEMQVGVYAGVDANRKPTVVVGVGFGYHF